MIFPKEVLKNSLVLGMMSYTCNHSYKERDEELCFKTRQKVSDTLSQRASQA
jgi:hypothetical protein